MMNWHSPCRRRARSSYWPTSAPLEAGASRVAPRTGTPEEIAKLVIARVTDVLLRAQPGIGGKHALANITTTLDRHEQGDVHAIRLPAHLHIPITPFGITNSTHANRLLKAPVTALNQTPLGERDGHSVADDKMIQQAYINQGQGVAEPLGDGLIGA